MENLKQGEADWLAWRKQGIGSSDAPIIMGVSPWKTPLQLWEEKTSELEETVTNWAQQRGHDLEPIARATYELTNNIDMPPALMVHPLYPFLRASLDGYNGQEKMVLEIKCPGAEDHQYAVSTGMIPNKYVPQLQHQLLVSEAKVLHYYSFDGVRGVTVVVEPDEKYQQILKKECIRFWDLVERRIPPMPTERDYIEETDYVNLENIAEWKRKKAQVELLTADMDELKNHICSRLSHPRMKGAGVRIQKIKKRGNIDYAKVPYPKGVNLEDYRKEGSEYFQFSVEQE